MWNNGLRKKSFLWSFTWVGVMLLAMGLVFLTVAIVMQLVPIKLWMWMAAPDLAKEWSNCNMRTSQSLSAAFRIFSSYASPNIY